MTVLRCSQKLLKRLKQPAAPPEPAAQDNPLGEWYGDVFFHRREPFVLLLNADTGAALVLPGRADDLRMLVKHAEYQLAMLLGTAGIGTLDAVREAVAWRDPIVFARTASRRLTALMNQRKDEAWEHYEYDDMASILIAARLGATLGQPAQRARRQCQQCVQELEDAAHSNPDQAERQQDQPHDRIQHERE